VPLWMFWVAPLIDLIQESLSKRAVTFDKVPSVNIEARL
jgi:hypothetical protein